MSIQRGTHPSDDVLQAFGQGKLDPSSAGVILDHLNQCEECRKQVQFGEDFLTVLGQVRSHSSTATPANTLPASVPGSKPSSSQPDIANLPPELANNPQYEIVRELGRGGMGVVYLAKNKLMDRLEVLKVVNKALLDYPGAAERFLREIRSAAKLHHANVVAAYSAVQQGELLAFAMEYVEGQDLASVVKAQGPLPVFLACYYVQQAALGLQHAFEKGMVHRDIKPQNLILAREGKKHIVKVLDFGLAKATREKTDDTGLTGEGKMLGTPDYIAPEQTLDAAKADIRADIYSLGCTLYYLLSGHPPFSASSLGAILLAHQMHEARPLNLERPEVPEELAAVVRKMMAKAPAKRFQTPKDVVQALAPFVKKESPKSSETPASAAETKSAGKQEATAIRSPLPARDEPKKQPRSTPVQEPLKEVGATPVGVQKSDAVPEPQPVADAPTARKSWLLESGIGVGVLVLALVGMWAGGVFKVKTKDGTLVLENLPTGAEVTVDGDQVSIDTGDGKPFELRVAAGRKHQLQVKKDGFKVFGEEVEIDAGDRRAIRVTLQPEVAAANSPPGKSVAANKGSLESKTVAKSPPDSKTATKQTPPAVGKVPRPKGAPPAPQKAAKTPPSESRPTPAVPDRTAKDRGFVPLFNGKNLNGWRVFSGGTGKWKVVEGVIVSSGPFSHLYSERGDYENFHLRFEAVINDGGNSGVFFRAPRLAPQFPDGYEAQINSTGRDPRKTGSLYGIVDIPSQLNKPGEWFTADIIADGDHIIIKINSKTVVDTHNSRFKKGHFALQQSDSSTVVKFRKIEIKELPAAHRAAAGGLPPEAAEAAKAYETACVEARAKLLADFDTAVERLAKGKGSVDPRSKLIEVVKEEKRRFEESGLIPWSEPMRPFVAKYFTSLGLAEDKLRRSYTSLVSAQPKTKKESMVTELQADLMNLVGIKLLAKWKHFGDGKPQAIHSLFSNGRIDNINGNATWNYTNGVLIYRWPSPTAPGGAWIDTLNVTADGMAYAGTNNFPPGKRPKITGIYLKDQ